MTRLLGVLAVGLAAAGLARADLLPPGTRNIPVNHGIETEKEYPEWVFYLVRGSGGVKKVAFDPKTPLSVPGSSAVGRGPADPPGGKERLTGYRSTLLVAVPKDAAKKYDGEKEFLAAVESGKVEGMAIARTAFDDHENAKERDPRKSIEVRFRVTKVDAKDGIVMEGVKGEVPKSGEEGEQSPAAAGPTSAFPWVAGGLGLAGVVGLAGVWFARRRRA